MQQISNQELNKDYRQNSMERLLQNTDIKLKNVTVVEFQCSNINAVYDSFQMAYNVTGSMSKVDYKNNWAIWY